jgi:hypothetical protein
MGDIWWVIIISWSVNVFSLLGGGTEADVGFPTCSGDTQPYTYDEYQWHLFPEVFVFVVANNIWQEIIEAKNNWHKRI